MTITHLDYFLKTVTNSKETKRALAVKMALLGMPYHLICSIIGISKGFISKWKKQFKSFGIEALRLAYKGSAPYLTYEQQQEIVTHLQVKNHWKLTELVDYIREKYNIVFKSKESYYSLFRKARIGWKKTQRTNPKKDPKKVEEKKKEIQDTLASLEEEIKNDKVAAFFVDESHLRWGDVLGYVWGKYAERITIPIVNTKNRQTYFGALNIKTKEVFIHAFPTGNSDFTIDFVKYLLSKCPEQRIVLIWDGASYHKGQKMQKYLEKVNKDLPPEKWKATCIILAPNAPEQNPVEDVWLKTKNYLRENPSLCGSWAQVKKLFVKATKILNFDFNKLNEYIGDLQLI